MTGSSIFDYVHTADHAEIAEQLGLSLTSAGGGGGGSGGLASPSSGAGSDEGGGSQGTNNPDGKFLLSWINKKYMGWTDCATTVEW